MRAALALPALVGLAALASCSLTRTSFDDCKTNTQCRTTFGIGSVCGGDGICEPAKPNPRCVVTFPEDLLLRPKSYPGANVIGVLMDRNVESQRARENAVRLAAKQVNEEKGLDGRLFGAVFCDIAEDAKYDSLKRTDAAVASATYLATSLGVPAIVGPSASTDTLAVFEAVKTSDVLVISPSATSPTLTGRDVAQASDAAPGLLWRTAPPDTLQGEAMSRHIRATFPTVNAVGVIHEKGAYGDALAKVFSDSFSGEGRTVTTFPYETTGQRDAGIVDAGTRSFGVVVFISSQTADSVAFLTSAATLQGYGQTNIFLTDGAATKDLVTGAASARALFPRVAGSRPAVPQGRVFELFRTSFNAAFKQDPNAFSFVPHTYDAAWLVFFGAAYGQRKEGRVAGATIARGIRRLSAGDAVDVSPVNWRRVADDLGAGKTLDITGASGRLDFDPVTEETSGLIDIWKINADGTAIETQTTIDPR